MLQSDFSLDFMGSHPGMLAKATQDRAVGLSPIADPPASKQARPGASKAKNASPTKFTSPSKASSSMVSPLKRSATKSGTKAQAKAPDLFRSAKKESASALQAPKQGQGFLVTSELLQPYAEKLFQLLHLMYEDLKLQRLRFPSEGRKLRRLLLVWLLEEAYCPQKTAYVAYYLAEADRDDP